MLERNLTSVSFVLLCNVVVRNVFMIVLEGSLTWVRFPSWWSVFYGNVVVPVGNLTLINFDSTFNVVDSNILVILLEGKRRCIKSFLHSATWL